MSVTLTREEAKNLLEKVNTLSAEELKPIVSLSTHVRASRTTGSETDLRRRAIKVLDRIANGERV